MNPARISSSASPSRKKPRNGVCAIQPAVEPLEVRTLLSSVVVNTIADTIDAPGSRTISLRDAIGIANAQANTTITFDAKVFTSAKTIVLSGSNLDLENPGSTTTITGPSAGVTISGNNRSNVFEIDGFVTANFSGITITKGSQDGILNNGNISLTNVTVSNNTSPDIGGGIYNGGTATLYSVTLTGNKAAGNGGAIYDAGPLHLTYCTIAGNSAAGSGGGMFNYAGDAVLIDVTLSGNTAGVNGGGIDNDDVTTLENVTLSGNSAANDGGGIYNDAAMALTNATVANNAAGDGGGVYTVDTTTLVNTLIAGNSLSPAAGAGPDVTGAFTSEGFNLIGKTDTSTGWTTRDFTGTVASPLNAQLSPLANNGGKQLTLLPASTSPVINRGSNSHIPSNITLDARGLPRIAGGTVDIGAVETIVTTTPPVTTPPVTNPPPKASPPPATGSITGLVFNDANANGKLDTGEKGIAGVKVYIDANKNGKWDSVESNVLTNTSGDYSLVNLAAGTYRISEVVPANDAITAPTAMYTDVTVAAGKTSAGINFADALATGNIHGTVFNDRDGNGKISPGETGFVEVRVYLDVNKDGIYDAGDIATLTGSDTNFNFTGLLAGTYIVRIVSPAGKVFTTASSFTLKVSAGQTSYGALFGLK